MQDEYQSQEPSRIGLMWCFFVCDSAVQTTFPEDSNDYVIYVYLTRQSFVSKVTMDWICSFDFHKQHIVFFQSPQSNSPWNHSSLWSHSPEIQQPVFQGGSQPLTFICCPDQECMDQ
jgi:hypothetical protein